MAGWGNWVTGAEERLGVDTGYKHKPIEPFSGLMSPGDRVLVYNVITSRGESNTPGGAEFRTHKEGFQLSLPGPKRPNSANSIHAKSRWRSTLSWFGFSKQRTDHWGNHKIPSWSPAEMLGQLKMAQGLTLYHCVLNRKHPLVCRGKGFLMLWSSTRHGTRFARSGREPILIVQDFIT